MKDLELPLRTGRLVLRRFEAADLGAYHAYHSLPETARFLPGEAKTYTQSMELVGRYANFTFAREGDWACLAIEAAGGPGQPGLQGLPGQLGLLGEVVLKWLPGRGQAEIGWSLAPAARGKGIGTEAAAALLRLCFQDLGFHRVVARLDALNTASAALCERLGMRLESTQVDKWHYKGRWATEMVYALLVEEWAARQSQQPPA